jgi:uncharacterized membrane protein YdjX (TVP38/TMEM64 family)
MKKSIWILFLYIIVLVIGYFNREQLIDWINESHHFLLPYMFVISTVLALVPVVPLSIFAGIMGAKYGIVLGALITWFGSMLAACFFYAGAKYYCKGFLRKTIKKYKGLQKYQQLIEENAFFAIFIARTIPIVPPPVVNIYSGFAKLPFITYFSASAIGKMPGILLEAFLGNQLFHSGKTFFIGILTYIIYVSFVLLFYRWWRKKKANEVD